MDVRLLQRSVEPYESHLKVDVSTLLLIWVHGNSVRGRVVDRIDPLDVPLTGRDRNEHHAVDVSPRQQIFVESHSGVSTTPDRYVQRQWLSTAPFDFDIW